MPLKVTNKQLPEGWIEKKFGEIALLNRGHNPPKSKFINQPKQGYVRFYQIRDGKSDDYEVYVPDTPQLHKVEPDDILMVAYRHIGRVFRGASGAFNVALCKITNKDRSILDDDYLFYIIPTEFVRGELMKQAERSLIPSMSVKHLAEIKIPVPPLSEQKRIVEILNEAFEGIDRAIANTEKNLINARELFESYLNAIFTQQGDDWTESKLQNVCKRITVGHVGSMKSKYQERGIPFLRSQNILPFAINLEKVTFIDQDFHDSLRKSKLRPGDVAIVRTGYPGTAAVIPKTLPDSNCSDLVIVTPGQGINPHYLCLFFNSAFGKKLVSGNLVGAAQKHFNVAAAKNVNLSCPPISQQEKLVSMCEELSAETRRLEAIYQQKLAALNELKQSILQKAFTGELTSTTPQQATETAKEVVAA